MLNGETANENGAAGVAHTTATTLVEDMKSGRADAGEVIRTALEQARADPLNAFISVAAEISRDEIDRARALPLAGLPVAVKDIIDVAGLPCTAGTPALREWSPPTDAEIVRRLKAAGALVVGNTNLHELSAGITGINPTFGACRNPYDPALMSGGSSSGSGAAVGAGIVPVALGGDTAGSNRIPASLCGCVGFRPTVGRYPSEGIVPLSMTRDTPGIFARSVADCVLIDGIVSGGAAAVQLDLSGLRLGVPRAFFYDDLDPGTAAVTEAALGLLEANGATLVEVRVEGLPDLSNAISLPLIFYETLRDIAVYLARHRCPIHPWEIVDEMAGTVERGWLQDALRNDPLPTTAYHDILTNSRPRILDAYRACFERDELDALALPTTPLPARPVGQDDTVELNGRQVSTVATYIRNTDATSIAGMPSISVPAGLTDSGLPVGVSFDGLPGTDKRLLAIAQAFEAVRPAFPRPTPR